MKILFIIISMTSLIFSCANENKNRSIGILTFAPHPAFTAVEKGIKDELKNDKHPYTFKIQNANGDTAAAASIASKFRSEKINIVVGISTQSSQALVQFFKTTPVVFTAVTDPVAAGLTSGSTRDDRNVTGVSDLPPVKRQLVLLNTITPIKRLGFIYSGREDNSIAVLKLLKEACDELHIVLIETKVINSFEVKLAAQSIVEKVDAFYVGTDSTVISAISSLCDVATKGNIPVVSADPSSSETNDVLVSLGYDYYKTGRETGRIIREILNGKKPADIDIKYMSDLKDITVVINKDVAMRLGIILSNDILKNANKIVEIGKITTR